MLNVLNETNTPSMNVFSLCIHRYCFLQIFLCSAKLRPVYTISFKIHKIRWKILRNSNRILYFVSFIEVSLFLKNFKNKFSSVFSFKKVAVFQCVLVRPDIKTKYEKYEKKIFLWRFPLSRFLSKTQRVNKIAMKSFSKNLSFGVDLNRRSRLLWIKLKHTT